MNNRVISVDWAPFRELIDQSQRFVLTCHIRPDCDALGSELGVAGLLDQLGKDVRIVNADAVPPRLSFIDPLQRVEVLGEHVTAADLADSDVILVLDTSAWGQLGAMADVIRGSQARIAVIDHHASEAEVAALVFKDDTAEATGRLIFDLAQYLSVPMTPTMASALFAAIATDTGWLRFPSTSSQTYRIAGELVAAGASPTEIFRELYERDSLPRAKLRGLVLSRMEIEQEGRLAHTWVRADDFVKTGALPSETEDFVNMALAIDGTEIAVMLTEQPAGAVKVSFRSRSQLDCARVAAQFGGGGHKAAAGATLEGDFSSVWARILDAVRQASCDSQH